MDLQTLRARASAALCAAALLAPATAAQGGATTFGGVGPLLRQADRDGDGRVDAAEWSALLATLRVDGEGRLDTIQLKALLLPLDVDGDGKRTAADVEALFAKLDRDGDGALSAEEARPAARAPAAETMLAVLTLPVADKDGDGAVSAAEREAFVAALKASNGGLLDERQVSAWVLAVVSSSGRERALFSPAVLIAQIDAELDADGDGRPTKEDLQALFAQVDTDGDGTLSAEELAPRRQPRGGGGEPQWLVRPEQRARPPLMRWQRNLDDALALSKASGKPLLLCVNMDNEPASDFAAFARYNDPDFVALASGFIALVASPDTHSPSEHDDRGRRLPDPRLGRVLCSEHVEIEPLLFERYFGGERFAPRHVGVAPDGKILFDIKLVQSFEGLERALRTHGRPSAATPPLVGDSDVGLLADPDPRLLMALEDAEVALLADDILLASPDARLREELERRFIQMEPARRSQVAEQAFSHERGVQHPELVVLALRDDDSSVRLQGLRVMIRHPHLMDLTLAPAAMAIAAMDPDLERELVGALREAAESTDPLRRTRAARLHASFAGLSARSQAIDVEAWIPLLAGAPRGEAPGEVEALTEAVNVLVAQRDERPADLDLRVHLAKALLRWAEAELAARRNPTFLLHDAVAAADEALALDGAEPRALGVSARAKYLLAEMEGAAEAAAKALPGLRREGGSPLARAVLESFVGARTQQLFAAMGEGAFEPEWVADLLAGYEVLLADPREPETRWVAYLQLLEALEARRPLERAIWRALQRHPLSVDLHAWLRFQVLRDHGAASMDGTCDSQAFAALRAADPAARHWFHGLAMLFAAEHAVRTRALELAEMAYERCAELFERAAAEAPSYASSSSHYRALALAGQARLEWAAGRRERALEHLLESLSAGGATARTADGLGATPLQLAKEVREALVRESDPAAARLGEAIDALESEQAPAAEDEG